MLLHRPWCSFECSSTRTCCSMRSCCRGAYKCTSRQLSLWVARTCGWHLSRKPAPRGVLHMCPPLWGADSFAGIPCWCSRQGGLFTSAKLAAGLVLPAFSSCQQASACCWCAVICACMHDMQLTCVCACVHAYVCMHDRLTQGLQGEGKGVIRCLPVRGLADWPSRTLRTAKATAAIIG